MNCEQGDLAWIVGIPKFSGWIVECIKVHPAGYSSHFNEQLGPVWLTDKLFTLSTGYRTEFFPDSHLKPLPKLTEEEKQEFLNDTIPPTKKIDSSTTANLSSVQAVKARIKSLRNRLERNE